MKTIDESAKEYANSFVDNDYTIETEAAVKHGVQLAQRWISVKEELPIAYETGNWDGKRSDFVLAKNIYGNWFKARTYQGFMDGHNFCDFVDDTDIVISNIVYWRPIELK